MSQASEAIVVMRGPHADLERAAEKLAEQGIKSAIVCPDANSGST